MKGARRLGRSTAQNDQDGNDEKARTAATWYFAWGQGWQKESG